MRYDAARRRHDAMDSVSTHEDTVEVFPQPVGTVAELKRDELLEQPAVRGRRGWVMRRLLLVADLLALVSAFALTELAFGGTETVLIGLLEPFGGIIVFAVS